MTRLQLSKNFTIEEFDCRDGTPVPDKYIPNVQKLVHTILQPLRDILRKPIHINSGYRTPAYNKKVGGKPRSQHLSAKAADITIRDLPPAAVADYLERQFNPPGLGRYKGFTHVDIRSGKRARW